MTTNEHISDLDLASFRAGVLSPADTIMHAAHLESCPECSNRYDEILKSAQYSRPIIFDFSPRSYLADVHLGYEQLSDYLAGVLDEDDTEIINIHVELCADCRKNLLSLELDILRISDQRIELIWNISA